MDTFIIIFYKDKYITENTNNISKTSESTIDNNIISELLNIEYNSSDKNGNTYYINAEKALVNLDDQKDNKQPLIRRCCYQHKKQRCY